MVSNSRTLARGFSLLEILVSILLMTIGLLGLLGVLGKAQVAELESYQRAQALILAGDMVDRINANRTGADCYNFTTNNGNGSPWAGAPSSAASAPAVICSSSVSAAAVRARATADINEWHAALNGAGEQLNGTDVGAMIGARGCVSYDTAANPKVFRVSVSWQGMTDTISPTSVDSAFTCATNQYGTEAKRRTVSLTFPVACLKAISC